MPHVSATKNDRFLARRSSVLAVIGVCSFAACDAAFSQTFAPARLIGLHDSEELKCPDNGRNAMFFCQAIVNKTGNVANESSTHCFGNSDDDRGRAQVLRKKLIRSDFDPAMIDGEPVRVYVSLRVLFEPGEQTCDITVFPNFGNQQDEFGRQYFGPQEIYTNGGWVERLPSRYTWGNGDSYGIAFAMSVAVDESGRASDGRVEVNNFSSERGVNRAIEALESSRFIPAFVDGQPRAGRYLEFMYYPPR